MEQIWLNLNFKINIRITDDYAFRKTGYEDKGTTDLQKLCIYGLHIFIMCFVFL